MFKEILKRQLAVLVLLVMLFSCTNISVYAGESEIQQNQSIENNRVKFDEMLKRNGLNPDMYKNIDITKSIIRGLEPDMFPSFEEYLFELERRLIEQGPIVLDKIRLNSLRNKRATNSNENIQPVINNEPVLTTVKENANRFIVKYKNSTASEKINKKFKNKIEFSKKVDKQKSVNKKSTDNATKKDNLEVIKFNQKTSVDELKSELEKAKLYDQIEYIQPDYEVNLSSTIDDQWGLLNTTQSLSGVSIDVNASPAWNISEGDGITVAVIDSGIDITHQGLTNSIWTNSGEVADNGIDDDGNGLVDDVKGWDFLNDTNAVHNASNTDDELHGTHVAGIIAAQNNNGGSTLGVAPKAKILPLKVFENNTAYTSNIIEAIQYAQSMGAKVANCSWGMSQNNQALKDAMANSTMLFACAAGNSRTNNDSNPVYPASYNLPNVISVASISSNGALSSFSNYGVNTVNVSAPGQSIKSTIPNNLYGQQSGTSMAAAFVSGQAALVFANYKELNATQTKNQIIYSSDRLSTLEDYVMDGNKINCEKSLTNLASADGVRDVYKINEATPVSTTDDVLSSFSEGDIKQIDVGINNLILLNDGTVYEWGDGDWCYYSDFKSTPMMVNFPGLAQGETITSISSGYYYNMAITSKGRAYSWGDNWNGQLGDGTIDSKTTPVCISDIPTSPLFGKVVNKIRAGMNHSLAITSEGKLYAWGSNSFGSVGDGTTNDQSIPVCISDIPTSSLYGKTANEISSGDACSMALTSEGKIYSWGYNGYGSLGDGTNVDQSTPVCISNIPTSALNGKIVNTITMGMVHSMAITSEGKVYTWGTNDGALGNGSDSSELSPVCISDIQTSELYGKIVNSISAGFYYSMAITSEGKAYAWGSNYTGQLGDGTTVNKSMPVCISDILASPLYGKTVSAVSAGFYHNMAQTSEGNLYACGDNLGGQLGDGSMGYSFVPLQMRITGFDVSQGEYVKAVSGTMALTSNGKVYAWGANYWGQVGDGTTASRSTPVCISDISTSPLYGKTVSAVYSSSYSSMVLTTEGKLYAWGLNNYGQIGDGTTVNKSTPVCISDIQTSPLYGKTVSAVYSSIYSIMALTSAGKVYAWGGNSYGQLGDGTSVNKSTPICISDISTSQLYGKTVSAISLGYNFAMFLTTEGKVYTCGYNYSGQLGDGTSVSKLTPVCISDIQTSSLYGKTVSAISTGSDFNMFLTTEGKVYTCGSNREGRLGDGTTNNKSTPVCISDISTSPLYCKTVTKISSASNNSMAITSEGKAYAWGYNGNGQLGDGTTTYKSTPVCISDIPTSSLYGKTVNSIYLAFGSSMALTSDGKVHAWGDNYCGQLGDCTMDNKSTPVCISDMVISPLYGKTVTGIYLNGSQSAILTGEGKVYICGSTSTGLTQSALPIKVNVPKNLNINVQTDAKINYSLTASTIIKPYKYKYYIAYDPSKYIVEDLCTFTSAKETTAGYIQGSDVIVVKHDATLGFIIITSSNESDSYTGILNNISFKAICDGEGKISVVKYTAQ